MADIQYVTDENGTPVAVQIPIQDWELIKAELRPYDADSETAAILEDKELYVSVMRGGAGKKTKRQTVVRDFNLMVWQVFLTEEAEQRLLAIIDRRIRKLRIC